MQRLSAEEFLAQVLDQILDISPELRSRLLQIARLSPAARVQQLEEAFQDKSGG
jgi:hypothetical protein